MTKITIVVSDTDEDTVPLLQSLVRKIENEFKNADIVIISKNENLTDGDFKNERGALIVDPFFIADIMHLHSIILPKITLTNSLKQNSIVSIVEVLDKEVQKNPRDFVDDLIKGILKDVEDFSKNKIPESIFFKIPKQKFPIPKNTPNNNKYFKGGSGNNIKHLRRKTF